MQISDSSSNFFDKTVNEHTDLIKAVAGTEYSRLSVYTHIIDYSELINIGATAVYVVLSSHPTVKHTNAYLSTAIKWAIRNEYRKRYKWYSCKHLSKDFDEEDDEDEELNQNNIREAIYETIFSIEELAEADNPIQIEEVILEMRFYKNKKVKEIATELNVTSSRVSRMIQTGLDRIKLKLKEDELL
jgi:RNA polymerase sigma factor (sigma-70 family)